MLLALLFAAAQADDLQRGLAALPRIEASVGVGGADWLVERIERRAGVFRNDRGELALDNGLVRRTFSIQPGVATIGLDLLTTGASFVRAVEPEAIVVLDSQAIAVGGLVGQTDRAYLRPEWVPSLRVDPAALVCIALRSGPTRERVPWKRVRHSEDRPWPPPGVSLEFDYARPRTSQVLVTVRYELYDGLPALSKSIEIHNPTAQSFVVDSFVSERLAVVEPESVVDDRTQWMEPALLVTSDYSMHGMDELTARRTTQWLPDPAYGTQVNYALRTPCLLESRPPLGPGIALAPGESLDSFTTFELLYDSTDRERRGLALRRILRVVAPWVTENPILMHVRSAEPAAVRLALDQCAEVGFEMAILSFGSGFDAETTDAKALESLRLLHDYAAARKVELGGYSLLASRSIAPEHDVIVPKEVQPNGPIFGSSPCLGSEWGRTYFERLKQLFERTGFDVLEHDGSYPGDVCASTAHPGHRGLADSQWRQWRAICDFYAWSRGRGIYLNVPDYYFLAGSNKTGMGYRETNWSLPRAEQVLHARQHIYDGTWTKTPSMGWMFVPLVEYQGGGAAATLEPLSEHLADFEQHLALNFGAGVQACYRGPRLYDSEATRALVTRWVDFFKAHRAILESDLIHLRRPDGRDVDAYLHVNPFLEERALLMVFNPLDQAVQRELEVPLYYAGLEQRATLVDARGARTPLELDRFSRARVKLELAARGIVWFVVERAR